MITFENKKIKSSPNKACWNTIEKAFETNKKIKGVIVDKVKGGFTVDLNGAKAFLPRSQVDINPVSDFSLMNVSQLFHILNIDSRRKNIIVSRRSVLEEILYKQRHEFVANLEEGQVIEGVVTNIKDYGAFVELTNGVYGLLHISEMSTTDLHPSEILTKGQTVKAMITGIRYDTHRISLSMTKLENWFVYKKTV